MRMRAALLLLGLASCGDAEPADLVLRHGAIYPLAGDTGTVETLAIRHGRIVYAGTDAGARTYIGDRTTQIELEGRMVLPGFHDTHMHPISGIGLTEPALGDLDTREAILDSVGRYAAGHPELTWIRGAGWQLPVFPNANPRREWLDQVVPDRPVYLRAADGHSAWVNSKALEIAGVTRLSRDPVNGRIERDPATGEPTGTLRERAMELVERHLPARTQDNH